MQVSIKQGNYEVVKTGSVLITNNEQTVITIDSNYNIVITYKDDPEDSAQGISFSPYESGVKLEVKNFNNPLGTSTTSPIAIASKGEQTIYLSLSVVAIGVIKVLTYGIYLGRKSGEENGRK